jgi:hypothetical protein
MVLTCYVTWHMEAAVELRQIFTLLSNLGDLLLTCVRKYTEAKAGFQLEAPCNQHP